MDVKVYVKTEPWTDTIAVYVVRRDSYLSKVFLATIKNGILEFSKEESKDGVEPDPTFRFPTDIWQLIVDGIEKETPSIKREVADAELVATKLHLKDMRDLVFSDVILNKTAH